MRPEELAKAMLETAEFKEEETERRRKKLIELYVEDIKAGRFTLDSLPAGHVIGRVYAGEGRDDLAGVEAEYVKGWKTYTGTVWYVLPNGRAGYVGATVFARDGSSPADIERHLAYDGRAAAGAEHKVKSDDVEVTSVTGVSEVG